jgi:hypothetical protein
VHAGRVIAIPPEQGDLGLTVEAPETHTLEDPREVAIFVSHAYPCQLSVSIVNEAGVTVRRLCSRQSTRPLKTEPEGSTFYWDGRERSGETAAPGVYRVRVSGYMGSQVFTAESAPITLAAGT